MAATQGTQETQGTLGTLGTTGIGDWGARNHFDFNFSNLYSLILFLTLSNSKNFNRFFFFQDLLPVLMQSILVTYAKGLKTVSLSAG